MSYWYAVPSSLERACCLRVVQCTCICRVPRGGGVLCLLLGTDCTYFTLRPVDCRALLCVPYTAARSQYTVPPEVEECLAAAADPAAQASCLAVEGNWFNAVVALDMDNGELAWGRRMSYMDVWVNWGWHRGTGMGVDNGELA